MKGNKNCQNQKSKMKNCGGKNCNGKESSKQGNQPNKHGEENE